MKDLTYDDHMRIAHVLIYKAKIRASFEENVKMAKRLLGEDKIVVIWETRR